MTLCRRDANVVDESDGAVKAGGSEGDGGGDFGHRLKGNGVDELEVVDFECRGSLLEKVVAGGIEVDGGGLFAVFGQIAGREKGAANAGGIGSMPGSELAVSGGEGQAIGFPDGGVSDDFDGDIEIADHAANEGKLLEVLVPEDGELGLKDVEELEHDGQDAIEVARPGGSAKVLREERFGDEGGVIGGIQAWDLRGEDEVHAFFFAESEIVIDRLGVVLEVLGAVELNGIDENRNGDGSGGSDFFTGCSDELEVSFVESSHGGHEGKGPGAGLEEYPYRMSVWKAGGHRDEC